MILLHEFLHAHGFTGTDFMAAQRDAIRAINAGTIRSGREGHHHYCDGGDLLAWLRRYRVRGLDYTHKQFLLACDAAEAAEAMASREAAADEVCARGLSRRETVIELARVGLRVYKIADRLRISRKTVHSILKVSVKTA